MRLRVPGESMSLSETAREHVVLKHVVEYDAKSARGEDGNQSEDQCDEINFEGEGFEHNESHRPAGWREKQC